jgi:AMP nucleosidase
MKTKEDIVKDWLPRYTGIELSEFGQYILLTNFQNYVDMFAKRFGAAVKGDDKPMRSATANNITIINFGMGSAMAATVMDLLSAIEPKAVLFLGKCGGLKKVTKLGDMILPIAEHIMTTIGKNVPILKPVTDSIIIGIDSSISISITYNMVDI